MGGYRDQMKAEQPTGKGSPPIQSQWLWDTSTSHYAMPAMQAVFTPQSMTLTDLHTCQPQFIIHLGNICVFHVTTPEKAEYVESGKHRDESEVASAQNCGCFGVVVL